jgi:hypothetical protein
MQIVKFWQQVATFSYYFLLIVIIIMFQNDPTEKKQQVHDESVIENYDITPNFEINVDAPARISTGGRWLHIFRRDFVSEKKLAFKKASKELSSKKRRINTAYFSA